MNLKNLLEEFLGVFSLDRFGVEKFKIYKLTNKEEFLELFKGKKFPMIKYIYDKKNNNLFFWDKNFNHLNVAREVLGEEDGDVKNGDYLYAGYITLLNNERINLSEIRTIYTSYVNQNSIKNKVIKKIESVGLKYDDPSKRYGNKSKIGRLKRLGIIK